VQAVFAPGSYLIRGRPASFPVLSERAFVE
jgi:hypothetical protein